MSQIDSIKNMWREGRSIAEIREVERVAKSLTRNAVEILNYFLSKKTNAILEGFNSKISIIKNRARGFRNRDNPQEYDLLRDGRFGVPVRPIM